MKRSDFLFWGFGLLCIYLGLKNSFNETISHAVYYPYPFEATLSFIMLIAIGVFTFFIPTYIDELRGVKDNDNF